MQPSGRRRFFTWQVIRANRLIFDVICKIVMKLIAYIAFAIAAGVFALGLLAGSLIVVETFVLIAVGFISLAIDSLRKGQRIIEQHVNKITISISGIENTISEIENGTNGLVVRKREGPRTHEETAEFLNSPLDP